MRGTRLIAVLVGIIAVAIFAADAHAYYHPGMGVFTSRDPGAGGAMRIGGGGPAAGGGFLPRDQYASALTPDRMPTPMAGSFARPHVGVNVYPAVSTPMPHPDGPNLYQYVRSNPVNLVDPAGLAAVDPGKDCGLSSNSDWAPFLGKDEGKPTHFWLKGAGRELWDFGPDYKWLDQKYGNHNYSDCTIFKYCRGEANWGNNSYAGRVGTHASHSLKLQGDFLFFEAKLQDGPKKGTPCKCATCGDIKGCLSAVRQKWNGTRYDHFARHCGTFALEAMSKCCVKE